jgi:hypothetical protein
VSTIKVLERHERMEKSTVYEIETVMGGNVPKWEALRPSNVKRDGKFITYHPDFTGLTKHISRVYGEPSFAFTDEAVAVQLAKALAAVWDRPLRVMWVQKLRITRQIGKTIMPVGGL